MKHIPYPPPGIPLFTHLLSLGINPNGETRCKNCGATDKYLNCSYCRQRKEQAYSLISNRSLGSLNTPTPGKGYTI